MAAAARAGVGAWAGCRAEAGAGGGAGAGSRGGSIIEASAVHLSKKTCPGNCARSRLAEGEIPPLMAAGSCAPGTAGTGAGAKAAAAAAAGAVAVMQMPSGAFAARSEAYFCAASATARAAEGFALFLRALRGELHLVILR